MIEDLVANLIQIKQNFAQNYTGNAHIQEVLPLESTKMSYQLTLNIWNNYIFLPKKIQFT